MSRPKMEIINFPGRSFLCRGTTGISYCHETFVAPTTMISMVHCECLAPTMAWHQFVTHKVIVYFFNLELPTLIMNEYVHDQDITCKGSACWTQRRTMPNLGRSKLRPYRTN